MELTSGMQFTRGRWRVRTIATPGHCVGHFSFLVQGPGASILIGGDQVFCDGRILLQNLPDVDIRQCATSMERLLALEFETLLPGHGRFSLERGKRHLEAAHAVLSGIAVPPNLV